MKKTNTILSIFSIIAFFTVLVITKNIQHNNVRYTDLRVFEKNEEGEVIEAAFDWMNARRLNAETGEFSLDDVYNARRIADQLQRQHYNAKTNASLGLQWDEMGPNNIGGRTRSVIFDRTDSKKMYATAVGGGVWVSSNSGASWSIIVQDTMRTFEALSTTSIVQAVNGDLYVGTGESQPGSSSGGGGSGGLGVPGEGIFKSTDGGLTFTQLTATKPVLPNSQGDIWAYVNDMAADPFDANKIWAGVQGAGLRVTTDGGTTWNTVATVPGGGVDDIKISSGNEVIVVARGGSYYKSIDGGANFSDQTLSGGFPTGASRLEFAIAPSDPNYIYVYAVDAGGALQGIYQSKDKGDTWNEIGPGGSASFNPPGNQGKYDAVIAVAPNDRERIWVGGQLAVFAWTPTSGWEQKSSFGQYAVHADHHDIVFHPTNSDIMFIGCDGGLYSSSNATDEDPFFTARNIGYRVTQYYAMAASIQGNVMGGCQDNGTHYLSFTDNSVQTATAVGGGDGGYCAIAKSNSGILFTEHVSTAAGIDGGALERSSNFGASSSSIFDDNIDCNPNAQGVCQSKDGVIDEGGPFITAFTLWEGIQDTVNDTTVNGALPGNPNAATDNEIKDTIIRSNINPAMFVIGSKDGIWACPDALDLSQSNPAWYKILDANANVTAFGFTNDGNTLFAGTNNGKMYRISGFRTATFGYWKNCNIILDINAMSGDSTYRISCQYDNDSTGLTVDQITVPFAGSYITGFGVDPNNDNHVLITLGGYSATRIYKTTNAMAGTPTISSTHMATLPPMPIYDAVIDYSNSNNYVVGTEMGVWASDNAGITWTEENRNGLGRLPVLDLVQEPIIDDSVDITQSCYFIYAATHGRGIFRTKSLANGSTCQSIVPESVGIKIAKKEAIKDLKIYPNPMSDFGTIAFDVEKQGDVYLKIFDMNGKLVRNDRLGNRSTGYQEISINTSELGMGTYFVHIQTASNNFAGKLLVVK